MQGLSGNPAHVMRVVLMVRPLRALSRWVQATVSAESAKMERVTTCVLQSGGDTGICGAGRACVQLSECLQSGARATD